MAVRSAPPIEPGPNDKNYYHPRPPYPYVARQQGAQGDCTIRLVDDGKGKVTKATVVRSSGSTVLDQNTTNFALAQWRGPANATWLYKLQYRLQ